MGWPLPTAHRPRPHLDQQPQVDILALGLPAPDLAVFVVADVDSLQGEGVAVDPGPPRRITPPAMLSITAYLADSARAPSLSRQPIPGPPRVDAWGGHFHFLDLR